jgi:hypothetical protein
MTYGHLGRSGSDGHPDRPRHHELRLHRGRVKQLRGHGRRHRFRHQLLRHCRCLRRAAVAGHEEGVRHRGGDCLPMAAAPAGTARTSTWPRRCTNRWDSVQTTAGCRPTTFGGPARRACGGYRRITSSCTRCTKWSTVLTLYWVPCSASDCIECLYFGLFRLDQGAHARKRVSSRDSRQPCIKSATTPSRAVPRLRLRGQARLPAPPRYW